MKKIQVLMSTWNGEKYLRQQLDSILAQDCEEKGAAQFCILVRDDGSRDGTCAILEEYAARYPQRISWYQGENVGVIGSFFELMRRSEDGADYYAFADQDDYWLKDKLRAGVESLNRSEVGKMPVLYCCKPRLVDEELQRLQSRIVRPAMRPSFANALVENIVIGCTAVMDHMLREIVCKELPEYTVMHDWWLYLTASCFGRVIYDETPHILYRQHGGNQVGFNVSRWAEFMERMQRFRGNRRNISRQLSEFIRIYQGRETEKMALARELLESRRSFIKRWRLVRRGEIYRQRKNDDRIFRLILLSGSF